MFKQPDYVMIMTLTKDHEMAERKWSEINPSPYYLRVSNHLIKGVKEALMHW